MSAMLCMALTYSQCFSVPYVRSKWSSACVHGARGV